MTRPRSRAGPSQTARGAAPASAGAARERAWTIVDTLPDRLPVTTGEVEAVATYLWPLIEALLREGKR